MPRPGSSAEASRLEPHARAKRDLRTSLLGGTTTYMAENQNPATSTAANADQPGRPYYESLRNTLRQTLDKKKKLDDQLARLEDEIYKNEERYLEETAGSGNIVRGFDGWVKGVAVGGRGGDDRRRGRVRDEDRIFSRSSVSWMRVRQSHV